MTIQHQESLWREHRERLYGFVLSRVSDSATAEDIVHDVLVRAYQNQDTLRDSQKFDQWLYQITRNAVIDHYRARKSSSPLPDNLPDADAEHGTQALTELSHCIQPFVRALPDHYRDAVELSEIEGLAQKETAKRLGLSLSGAKSRVQRARRLLAEMMLECCKVEFDAMGGIMSYDSRRCSELGRRSRDSCTGC